MNVVEQQNAFASRLKPVHRQSNDFLWRDTVMPVIRRCAGAEVYEPVIAFRIVAPGGRRL
jgi:hypothetical protein